MQMIKKKSISCKILHCRKNVRFKLVIFILMVTHNKTLMAVFSFSTPATLIELILNIAQISMG